MKRSELKNTLELVSLGLADTNLVPIFQCFCFKQDYGVLAYNDQICIAAACPINEEFAVHGKTLLGLLKNSSAENLEFKLTDNEVTIKADRSTFKLPFMPASDFLFSEPPADKMTSDHLTEDFLNGLKSCLTTVSKDQAQPALMGVSFVRRNTLFGCDGDAVTKYTLDIEAEQSPTFFLPNAFCHATLHLSGAVEAETVTGTLALSDEWAIIDFDDDHTAIYGRLIQNDKPIDFDALIEKTVKTQPTFVEVPAGLDEALARARVIADIETAPTVFTIEANRLKLLTDGRAGTVRDSLGMKHPDVQATFSAEMVQRTIGLCDEICVMENCLVGRKGTKLLQVVSCMDDKG